MLMQRPICQQESCTWTRQKLIAGWEVVRGARVRVRATHDTTITPPSLSDAGLRLHVATCERTGLCATGWLAGLILFSPPREM